MPQFIVQNSRVKGVVAILSSMLFLISGNSYAQSSMMGDKLSCPMCGGMGWVGMTFGVLMMISIVVALIALSLYLFRRAGPRSPRPR